MRGLRRQFIRFMRFLRGETIYDQRDQIRYWLTLLVLTVLLVAALVGGLLALTAPRSSYGGTVLVWQTPTPLGRATPTSTPTLTGTPVPVSLPNFSHIFLIVLENTSYERLIGNSQAPFFNGLANQYSLATRFYAITHPSLPNYFALTGGTTFGVTDDCAMETASCQQKGKSIADLIEQSGRTWVAYFESMPAPCSTRSALPYTVHYNPFVYYADLVQNQQRCQSHVLPYNQAQFFSDLRANRLPNFVWISPNLYHDMHEGYGTIAQGDQWLAENVAQIMDAQAFQNNGLIIITFDEGDDGNPADTSGCCGYTPGGGHIATLLISPLVKRAYRSLTHATLYGLLRTIEDAWGLPHLGNSAIAPPMVGFFS